MLELFNHIIHLDFEWLFDQYATSIYLILFLVIFVETGLVVMPFLPGDSLLFTAGLFANNTNPNTGEPYLNLVYLLSLLLIAAILGDNTNYWIGRKLGLRIFQIKIRKRALVKQAYLDKTEAFFEKNGTKAIIMARFVPIVRTFAPFAAGIGKMKYRKFLAFDVIGGVLWIFGLTFAGYFLGEFEVIKEHIDLVCLGIIFVSVLPMIISFIRSKMKSKANNA